MSWGFEEWRLWLEERGLPLKERSDLDELGLAKVWVPTSITWERRFFSLPLFRDMGMLMVGVPILVWSLSGRSNSSCSNPFDPSPCS
jgi:hypothetical protein